MDIFDEPISRNAAMQDEALDYTVFMRHIDACASMLSELPRSESIKIVGHLDSDGICSSAIMINALIKDNRKYSLTILPTISNDSLEILNDDPDKYVVFVDLGSGNIDSIASTLRKQKIFILDHHIPQSVHHYDNIVHVNPHLFGIDGSSQISGAGVVFLFTQSFTSNKNTEMSRIAIVGAIGDVQENNGFKGLNKRILDTAVSGGYIDVRRGLRFFGVQTKPLYKLLQYSSDILIPGVSGSESGALQFLSSIGIDPRSRAGWKKIADLSEDEKKRLIAGIILKREGSADASDIFCNAYLLTGEDEDSPFRDAKEFSTLLNACGRLSKASIGIGACLNDNRMKELAVQTLTQYRKEIVNALNWYKDNSGTSRVIQSKNYIIINAGEDILPTMIGTLGSIISKSFEQNSNMFILSLARNYDGTTKISLRVSGNPQSVNLKEIISSMIAKINHGSSGGHLFASGAVIDSDYEDAFIDAARTILDKASL